MIHISHDCNSAGHNSDEESKTDLILSGFNAGLW